MHADFNYYIMKINKIAFFFSLKSSLHRFFIDNASVWICCREDWDIISTSQIWCRAALFSLAVPESKIWCFCLFVFDIPGIMCTSCAGINMRVRSEERKVGEWRGERGMVERIIYLFGSQNSWSVLLEGESVSTALTVVVLGTLVFPLSPKPSRACPFFL